MVLLKEVGCSRRAFASSEAFRLPSRRPVKCVGGSRSRLETGQA
jgi:hypothetical protein